MARISNQEALSKVGGSPYDLIVIAAQRGREYNKGERPHINKKGGRAITALREIEEGYINSDYKETIVSKYQTQKSAPVEGAAPDPDEIPSVAEYEDRL